MFRWLERTRCDTVSIRWQSASSTAMAQWLPQLGCVLYLPATSLNIPIESLPSGVLADSQELAALLSTRWLRISSAVSCDGPREWMDCLSADGQVYARIYLLPDTDYLAWDAMLSTGQAVEASAVPRFRGAMGLAAARLSCFSCRAWAGLYHLSVQAPPHVSGLGEGVARDIIKAESLALR